MSGSPETICFLGHAVLFQAPPRTAKKLCWGFAVSLLIEFDSAVEPG
jgi:hypothetical protein